MMLSGMFPGEGGVGGHGEPERGRKHTENTEKGQLPTTTRLPKFDDVENSIRAIFCRFVVVRVARIHGVISV